MTHRTDRRTDHARRRRVELLLAHVRSARAEIVARGLDAVHGPHPREAEPADREPAPEKPPTRS